MTRTPQIKRGPCAKQTVRCTILYGDGHRIVGENYCLNPQPTCPRGNMPTGTGYEKCTDICKQEGHAEVIAARIAANLNRTGGVAYVEGHTYVCAPCEKTLNALGVTKIVMAPPPLAVNEIVWY